MAYTTTAAALAGGAAQMAADIQTMVAIADAALRGAGTGGIRLVGTLEVGFVASSVTLPTLVALQNPSDGVLDELHPMREQLGADVVTIVTGAPGPLAACGIGYLVGGPTGAPFAFNVVVQQCVLGLTLAHEVGHNLGLHHDWYVTAAGGLRPSSKGFVSLAGRFLTIMAYSDHCTAAGLMCTTIAAFSNPSSPQGGFPTGVAIGTNLGCTVGNVSNPPCDADSVSTLTDSAPAVAGYRFTNRLDSGQSLGPSQSLKAKGADCQFVYQTDGNLVGYSNGTPYWNSGTGGNIPGSLVMQGDGNLVLYDGMGAPVWLTGTGGYPGAFLVMQDDCNVVLYAADGAPLWFTGAP